MDGVVGVADAESSLVDGVSDERDFLDVRDFFDEVDTSDGDADGSLVVVESPEASVLADSDPDDDEPDERVFLDVRDFFVEDDDESAVGEVVAEVSPAGVELELVEPEVVSVGGVAVSPLALSAAEADGSGVLAGVDVEPDEEVEELDAAPGSGVAVLAAGVPILAKKSLRKSPVLAGAAAPAGAVAPAGVAAPAADASACPDAVDEDGVPVELVPVPAASPFGVAVLAEVELPAELLSWEPLPEAAELLSVGVVPSARDWTSFFGFEALSACWALLVVLLDFAIGAFLPLLSAAAASAA